MRSDNITVTNAGQGMEAALEQAAAAAAFRGLTGKDALHLQLLAEEMLGMLRQITGKTEAVFWVESEGKKFQLHLAAHPIITDVMRGTLLSVSSTGKNAAAVGVMGKLRDIFERAFDAVDLSKMSEHSNYYLRGLLISADPEGIDPMSYALNASMNAEMMEWSMQKYKSNVEKDMRDDDEARAEWDELEKSIVANIADEIAVSIRSGDVEMIVYKKF